MARSSYFSPVNRQTGVWAHPAAATAASARLRRLHVHIMVSLVVDLSRMQLQDVAGTRYYT